ncbi:adenylosuccinate synthetase [Patescibacteria group bacterium]|nr:adenylosuccinate synthetase [Patescibacteria group bacterium]
MLKDGTRVALHELPGGAIIETAQVYLGQSRLVNIKNVIKEMKEIEDHGIESMIEKD